MIKINCDMCGKVDGSLSRALIENVELAVCVSCSKFGKIIGPVRTQSSRNIEKTKKIQAAQEKEEKVELIVDDYPELIKRKRESMGLSQKDFATKLNEKESTIHQIETRKLEPSISLAKKLEKALGIKLIDNYEEKFELERKKSGAGFTLGDFIKVRK